MKKSKAQSLNNEESLLNKAYCSSGERIIIRWANDAIGSMVDYNGDDTLRFVETKLEADIDGDKGESNTSQGVERPIVATGIVVHWLKSLRTPRGTRVIFEEYYDKCLNYYTMRESISLDACERNLPEEFGRGKHLREEIKKIEQSKAIYPYLTEEDVNQIEELTKHYCRFVRNKAKELYPVVHTQGYEREELFLSFFAGPAAKCMSWICDEYNLPPMGPGWGQSRVIINKVKHDYRHQVEFPRLMRLWMVDYEELRRDLYYIDSKLMEEIKCNLDKCPNREDKERYIVKMLSFFKSFADPFCPIAKIKERENAIEDDKINQSDVTLYKSDIEYWREKSRKLLQICNEASSDTNKENPSMENCLSDLRRDMIHFYQNLSALLLTYKIKLMDVMEKCGVYLSSHVGYHDYVDGYYVPSSEYAQKLLSEIENSDFPPTTPDTEEEDVGIPLKLFHKDLDERIIISTLRNYDRKGLGTKQFALAAKEILQGIGWLVKRKNTDFVQWLNTNQIVYIKGTGLTHVKRNDLMENIKKDLKNKFLFLNRNEKWEDRMDFIIKGRPKINKGL